MVITAEAIFDTLGGGTFEWQTIDAARRLLAEQRFGLSLEAFSLGGRSGQCCGGFVNILLEAFPGATAHVAIFGAGHVGHAIIKLCMPLPWQLHWFDSRSDAFSERDQQQPQLTCYSLQNIPQSVAALPADTHVLVMTHNHDEDYAIVSALLGRPDIATIGLIGSDSKWASFEGRLKRDDYSGKQRARVRCPIGRIHSTKLANKTPYAIALTAVTELLWLTDKPPIQQHRGLDADTLRTLFTDATTTTS
jgi:xanthine dehydrogenase accessory factor